MMRFRPVPAVAFALMLAGVFTAFAGTASISGAITSTDPQMRVVSILSPNCASQGSTLVRHDAIPFSVTLDGAYTLDVSFTGTLASLYLMTAAFNPDSGLPTCLAADNTKPIGITYTLTANTTYYAVIFDDTFAQSGVPSYTLTANGPGDIVFGTTSTVACPYPLPAGSVVYNLPQGAPAFFAADLGSQTTFNIPAGNWYVSEFSGDFAKLWIACQANPVWVPTNAVAR